VSAILHKDGGVETQAKPSNERFCLHLPLAVNESALTDAILKRARMAIERIMVITVVVCLDNNNNN
jgi:hypothetical protein